MEIPLELYVNIYLLLLEFNNNKILQNARYLDKKRAKDLIIFS